MAVEQHLAALMAKLLVTVQTLAGYPAPADLPAVRVVPAAELAMLVCAGACRAQSAYLPDEGILLADHLHPADDVRHRAVLLHELVHHAQHLAGAFADLPRCGRYQRREQEAYAVEHAYLRRYNLSASSLAGPRQWLGASCGDPEQTPSS